MRGNVTVLLSSVLALSLVGCGGPEEEAFPASAPEVVAQAALADEIDVDSSGLNYQTVLPNKKKFVALFRVRDGLGNLVTDATVSGYWGNDPDYSLPGCLSGNDSATGVAGSGPFPEYVEVWANKNVGSGAVHPCEAHFVVTSLAAPGKTWNDALYAADTSPTFFNNY